jgi:hypothetical protein
MALVVEEQVGLQRPRISVVIPARSALQADVITMASADEAEFVKMIYPFFFLAGVEQCTPTCSLLPSRLAMRSLLSSAYCINDAMVEYNESNRPAFIILILQLVMVVGCGGREKKSAQEDCSNANCIDSGNTTRDRKACTSKQCDTATTRRTDYSYRAAL